MQNQRTILLALGLIWNALAVGAPVQTNEVHEKALEVLRKTMDNLEGKQSAPAKRGPILPHEPTFAEVEQLYLEGKISAREFQKYLDDHKIDPAKLPKRDPQSRAVEVLRNPLNKAEPTPPRPATATPNPAAVAITAPKADTKPDAASPADQSKFSEVEKKMDELLRLKAAREATAATNAPPNTANNTPGTASPKTKRERLDELLKLYIEGKIPDAEYKEKRGKLVSAPD